MPIKQEFALPVSLPVIDDGNSGELCQCIECILFTDVFLKFKVNAFSMGSHNGHTDAGRGDLDVGVVPDLTGLLDKFELLLVVAQLDVHSRVVREEVEGVLQERDRNKAQSNS